MALSLESYLEHSSKFLEVSTMMLCDCNGVEIASWGEEIEDSQLLAAMFQSTLDNSSKLPIGKTKTITLYYTSKILIQRSMDSVFLIVALPAEKPVAKVLETLEKLENDLAPLTSHITLKETQ